MCKKYGYSLDSLHHLFHSLIIPLFTYGILVWGVASYDKYLSNIGKFQSRVVRFGFIKGVPPILSLLEPEASDKKLWKSITNSTKGLLADLLPPSKTRLPNRGHSYVQSTLSKSDTFGAGTMSPSKRDVRLIESQIKGVKKGRGQL